jgi:hypothetical protein
VGSGAERIEDLGVESHLLLRADIAHWLVMRFAKDPRHRTIDRGHVTDVRLPLDDNEGRLRPEASVGQACPRTHPLYVSVERESPFDLAENSPVVPECSENLLRPSEKSC